mmetsp:Transcript_98660/g.283583  ORF Transcript_98660/g.283583 Transcript_98660/m.283583 type:complete len:84 (+) Transcript_98660:287-538(+)
MELKDFEAWGVDGTLVTARCMTDSGENREWLHKTCGEMPNELSSAVFHNCWFSVHREKKLCGRIVFRERFQVRRAVKTFFVVL